MEHYEKKETLGQGQFGIVFKAEHKTVRYQVILDIKPFTFSQSHMQFEV